MVKFITGAIATVFLVFGVTAPSRAAVESRYQPKIKTYKGVSYVSGGIGTEEREALSSMAKDDNLELSFASRNRDYLGGAKVLIKDDKGKKVLDAVFDGPLFFAKLPPGRYAVMATARGKTFTQTAQVSDKDQTRLYFVWKESGSTAPASANLVKR